MVFAQASAKHLCLSGTSQTLKFHLHSEFVLSRASGSGVAPGGMYIHPVPITTETIGICQEL